MSNLPSITMRIIRDSREQAPLTFTGYPVEVAVGALASGDYSLHGFENRIALERKSLPDLVACLGPERERFTRELQRLKAFDAACVIVEASSDDLRRGLYRSKLDAGAAWQSCLAFMQRYRVPFVWCRDRADAERATFDLLRHFHRDRERELAALFYGRARARMTLGRTGGAGAMETGTCGRNAPRANVGAVRVLLAVLATVHHSSISD